MLYRRTGEQVLEEEALYQLSRTNGTRCAWLMGRGFASLLPSPCGNSSKLIRDDGFYYCPVHLGLLMQPGKKEQQAVLADERRRHTNAQAWACRIAVHSERLPNDTEVAFVQAVASLFLPHSAGSLRVVEKPMLFQEYAYAVMITDGRIEVGDVCGYPQHPRSEYSLVTNEARWEYYQRLPGHDRSNYKMGKHHRSYSRLGFFFTSIRNPFTNANKGERQ